MNYKRYPPGCKGHRTCSRQPILIRGPPIGKPGSSGTDSRAAERELVSTRRKRPRRRGPRAIPGLINTTRAISLQHGTGCMWGRSPGTSAMCRCGSCAGFGLQRRIRGRIVADRRGRGGKEGMPATLQTSPEATMHPWLQCTSGACLWSLSSTALPLVAARVTARPWTPVERHQRQNKYRLPSRQTQAWPSDPRRAG